MKWKQNIEYNVSCKKEVVELEVNVPKRILSSDPKIDFNEETARELISSECPNLDINKCVGSSWLSNRGENSTLSGVFLFSLKQEKKKPEVKQEKKKPEVKKHLIIKEKFKRKKGD